ncbi:hypothetical protein [Craterilacuibacter sp. RT1T]|uniref:hypothetical protein n=1 Tax=Craterilacuibacter sp. RT1T TaxID=2942211 RepID=UPI0020BF8668|nr:hypothetical protein [Craterilacuibacter sp. RT1T]MCL6264416.1 hypothetical protein [Craterilacuibacter sp. RT1T]
MRTRRYGYILLEALLALLLLAVGLLAGLRLASNTLSSSAEAKARAFAQYYAADKLESLRALINAGEYQRSACPSAGSLLVSSGAAEQTTVQGTIFSRSWQVAPQCAPNYQTLRVEVTWQDKTGPHSIELASLLTWSDPARMRER